MENAIFSAQDIESITKVLAEYTTGSKITNMLANLKLYDMDSNNTFSQPPSTKWKRLYNAAIQSQNTNNSGYSLVKMMEWIFDPVNFINSTQYDWNDSLNSINKVLQYSGLMIDDSGKVIKSTKVNTFSDGSKRFNSLKNKLIDLNIHSRLLAACNPEILQDNYFHLIFESSKIVLSKIREISGIHLDGNKLINKCFDIDNPIIVFNTLQTDSERNEYLGLKYLLKQIVCFYRNPKAHDPKIYSSTSEMDALFALVSMSKALKVLDNCSRSYIS